MLAGPGTGKTTTMVEAIVDRIERRGVRPRLGAGADLLPQGRRAAARPGDRAARADAVEATCRRRSTPSPTAWSAATHRPSSTPPRCRCCPRPSRTSCCRSCSPTRPSRSGGPSRCALAIGTRGFAREVQAVIARARERGLDPDQLVELGRDEGVRSSRRPGLFLEQYLDVLGGAVRDRLPRPDHAWGDRGRVHRPSCGRRTPACSWTSTRTPTRARSRCCGRLPATGATSSWWATPTSRSTASAAPTCAGSSSSPRSSRPGSAGTAPVVALGTTRRFGSRLLRASRSIAAGISMRGAIPRATYDTFRNPRPRRPSSGRARRGAHLRHRSRRDRARRRPAPPRASRGRHRLVRHGGAGALRPRVDPAAAPHR